MSGASCTAGTLSAIGTSVAVTSPRQIRADEEYVYVLSSSGLLSRFAIGTNGTLAASPDTTVATDSNPSKFVVSPVFHTPGTLTVPTTGITSQLFVTDSVLNNFTTYSNSPPTKGNSTTAGAGAASVGILQ